MKTANNKEIDPKSSAYAEGFAARTKKQSGWSNPYDGRSRDGVNWQAGWKASNELVSKERGTGLRHNTGRKTMLKIGFSGTRYGMSPAQAAAFFAALPEGMTEFHHGDCIGADANAAQLVQVYKRKCVIVKHPPKEKFMQANAPCDLEREPLPFHDRNRNIVAECDVLYAAPFGMEEEANGGTWGTIREARKLKKPHIIFLQSGEVIRHEGKQGGKLSDATPTTRSSKRTPKGNGARQQRKLQRNAQPSKGAKRAVRNTAAARAKPKRNRAARKR
jgi:hypothetical protein